MVPFISCDVLKQFSNLCHGFTTRQGGVSKDVFTSLNTSKNKGDRDENVMENRRRIAQTFDTDPVNLITLNQIHSNKVVVADENWTATTLCEADALVTTIPDKLLGIMTADCVPVLLADPEKGVIAAAHAGWQGAVSGILQNTIEKMLACGAERSHIYAAIGPCIWQASYEVDQQFYENLSQVQHLFIKGERPGHWLFDLPGFVIHLLNQEKIASVTPSAYDTYAHPDLFFSFRRKTHLKEPNFGNSLSVICLKSSLSV